MPASSRAPSVLGDRGRIPRDSPAEQLVLTRSRWRGARRGEANGIESQRQLLKLSASRQLSGRRAEQCIAAHHGRGAPKRDRARQLSANAAARRHPEPCPTRCKAHKKYSYGDRPGWDRVYLLVLAALEGQWPLAGPDRQAVRSRRAATAMDQTARALIQHAHQ